MQIIRIQVISTSGGVGMQFRRQAVRLGGIIGRHFSEQAGSPARRRPWTLDMPATPDHSEDAPIDVQRTLMDRARRQAASHDVRPERPLLPRLVGLALALVVVVVVLFAFDRFLASMQRFLALPVVDPAGDPAEAIPAYVVPLEPATEDAAPGVTGASPVEDPARDGTVSRQGPD